MTGRRRRRLILGEMILPLGWDPAGKGWVHMFAIISTLTDVHAFFSAIQTRYESIVSGVTIQFTTIGSSLVYYHGTDTAS
jgi:hypothetical protein